MHIELGNYKHYKGHVYEVIGTARHSETLEELVVYRLLADPTEIWVRPIKMFLEQVVVNQITRPRFEKIST